jgi:hypothetical protein
VDEAALADENKKRRERQRDFDMLTKEPLVPGDPWLGVRAADIRTPSQPLG